MQIIKKPNFEVNIKTETTRTDKSECKKKNQILQKRMTR